MLDALERHSHRRTLRKLRIVLCYCDGIPNSSFVILKKVYLMFDLLLASKQKFVFYKFETRYQNLSFGYSISPLLEGYKAICAIEQHPTWLWDDSKSRHWCMVPLCTFKSHNQGPIILDKYVPLLLVSSFRRQLPTLVKTNPLINSICRVFYLPFGINTIKQIFFLCYM